METPTKNEFTQKPIPRKLRCVMCSKPATRFVDGEPSCDYHVNQVYERQMEEYVSKHLN
jgi:hypothetical protein